MRMQKNVPLALYTTMKLGGSAAAFVRCGSVDEVRDVLAHARTLKKPLWVLGGGSNTIVPDAGFDGLVLQIDLRGIAFADDGDEVIATVAAGEPWDAFVAETVTRGLCGIEALSGIPGLVGATPIQNVGAYGQEVREVIETVVALDRATGTEVHFTNAECVFAYRKSRFKTIDDGRYLITSVVYRLKKNAVPVVRYGQLRERLRVLFATVTPTVAQVREAVLALRREKSMVLDPADPNSVSCGSFFTNPMLSQDVFAAFIARCAAQGIAAADIPSFPDGDRVKVSAAWLIEHAGFAKGYVMNGAAISEHHALALVNRGATAKDIFALADRIMEAVHDRFGITLEREPVVAG